MDKNIHIDKSVSIPYKDEMKLTEELLDKKLRPLIDTQTAHGAGIAQNARRLDEHTRLHKEHQKEFTRLGLNQEKIMDKLDTILEVLYASVQRIDKLEDYPSKVDSNEGQIDVTQKALKDHITDQSVHIKQ